MSGHLVRVLVVDDHELVRLGIRHLLGSTQRFQVVGEAENGVEAISLAVQTQPRVVILDHSLPGESAMGIASDLRSILPKTEILLFSHFTIFSEISRAIEAGISGVVLKSQKESYLLAGLETVSGGGRYFLPTLGHAEPEMTSGPSLSVREREVVRLLAEGNMYKGIARSLGISKKTVECYRTNAMDKLRLTNTSELVRYALRAGLVAE